MATYYPSKLSVTGSKFTVVPPLYYSRSNPASLGFIERDMVFLNSSNAGLLFRERFHEDEDTATYYPLDKTYGMDGTTEYGVQEGRNRISLGYYFPWGEDSGFGAEVFQSNLWHGAKAITGSLSDVKYEMVGGLFSIGNAFSKHISTGISFLYGYIPKNVTYDEDEMTTASFYGGEAGIILKNLSGSLFYSLYLGLSTFTDYENDVITGGSIEGDEVPAPLYMDHSMTFGGAAGATVRLFEDYDIDIQAIYREKPSRCTGEELIPELSYSIMLTWNGAFVERE